DGDFRHLVAALLHALENPPAVLARLRVHADPPFVPDLAAIGADVGTELGVRGDYGSDVDVAATVRRVVLQPGVLLDVDVVATQDDFAAGRAVGGDLHRRQATPGTGGIQALLQCIDDGAVHGLVVVGDVAYAE